MRIFLFIFLFPVLLCAYEAESDWRDSTSLVEVWGNAYQKSLQGKGVDLNVNYVGAVAGNLTGGREQGVCYADYFSATSTFDLEKLLGWSYLSFAFGVNQADGGSLSERYVGNEICILQNYTGDSFRLSEVYLAYSRKEYIIRAGRLASGDLFMSYPVFSSYMSCAVNGHPFAAPHNTPLTSAPYTQWGADFSWEINKAYTAHFGVYNTNGSSNKTGNHGLDFSFHSEQGLFLLAQLSARTHFFGLEGVYTCGGLGTSEKGVENFSNGHMERNFGVYVQFEQRMWENKTGDYALLFACLQGYPGDRNQIPFYISVGAVYEGLWVHQKPRNDFFALNYSRACFSSELANQQEQPQSYEAVYELTYGYPITQFALLQPDLQYIQNPAGTHTYKNAWVLGLQVSVTLY